MLLVAASLISSVAVVPGVSASEMLDEMPEAEQMQLDGDQVGGLLGLLLLPLGLAYLTADISQDKACQQAAYTGLPACRQDLL